MADDSSSLNNSLALPTPPAGADGLGGVSAAIADLIAQLRSPAAMEMSFDLISKMNSTQLSVEASNNSSIDRDGQASLRREEKAPHEIFALGSTSVAEKQDSRSTANSVTLSPLNTEPTAKRDSRSDAATMVGEQVTELSSIDEPQGASLQDRASSATTAAPAELAEDSKPSPYVADEPSSAVSAAVSHSPQPEQPPRPSFLRRGTNALSFNRLSSMTRRQPAISAVSAEGDHNQVLSLSAADVSYQNAALSTPRDQQSGSDSNNVVVERGQASTSVADALTPPEASNSSPPLIASAPPVTRFSPGGLSALAAALASSAGLKEESSGAHDASDGASASSSIKGSSHSTGRLSGAALQAAWKAKRQAALAAIVNAGDLGQALQQSAAGSITMHAADNGVNTSRSDSSPSPTAVHGGLAPNYSPDDDRPIKGASSTSNGASSGTSSPFTSGSPPAARRRPPLATTATSASASSSPPDSSSNGNNHSGSWRRGSTTSSITGSVRGSPSQLQQRGSNISNSSGGGGVRRFRATPGGSLRTNGSNSGNNIFPGAGLSQSYSAPSSTTAASGDDLASLVAAKVAELDAEIGRYRARAAELDVREAALTSRRSALDAESSALAGLKADTEAWCASARAQAARILEGAQAEVDTARRVAARQAKAEASAAAGPGDKALRWELEETRTALARVRAELGASESKYRQAVDRHRAEREGLKGRIAQLEEQLAAAVAAQQAQQARTQAQHRSQPVASSSLSQLQHPSASPYFASPSGGGGGSSSRLQPVLRHTASSPPALRYQQLPSGAASAPFANAANTADDGTDGGALHGGSDNGSALIGIYDPNRYASAAAMSSSVEGPALAHRSDEAVNPQQQRQQHSVSSSALSPSLRHHLLTCVRPGLLGHGVVEEIATGRRPDLHLVSERMHGQQQQQWQGGGQHGAGTSSNGKVERRFSDGTRVLSFPNGTEKEERPDGTVIVRYNNGDVKRTVPASAVQLLPGNGVVESYFYAEAGTLHTSYLLGGGGGRNDYEVFEFPSGQVELHRRLFPAPTTSGSGQDGGQTQQLLQKEILLPPGDGEDGDGSVKVVTIPVPAAADSSGS